MRIARSMTILAGASAAVLLALPAQADVKAGVDSWAKGHYAAAVKEWQGPAAKGDADAQFNMAQAYRLGRGVPVDAKRAEDLYARAAAQGHLKAADNYGLLLFQDGRREQGMPYIQAAAGRGDPRAQYLLGISHFNGDLVPKDWVQAYALLTLANSAGLPQAKPAIKQMDDFIPLAQRQQAQSAAQQIKANADANLSTQLAAADLGTDNAMVSTAQVPAASPVRPARTLPAIAAVSIPRPMETTDVTPSVAAARAAVEEAIRVTGTDSPANAGADYGRRAVATSAIPVVPPARMARAVVPAATPAPSPSPTPTPSSAPTTRAARTIAGSGPWKVQLGAFSVQGNANRLWNRLSDRAELSGSTKLLVPAGGLTRLQAGGFANRGAAQNACNALKRGGQACLVTR